LCEAVVTTTLNSSHSGSVERRFRRSVAELDAVFRFLDEGLGAMRTPPQVSSTIQFAVEELFTNMVKYNPSGDPEITCALERDTMSVIVSLTDCGGELFDMTLAPETDTAVPLEKRQIGGLGIQLLRQMVDGFRFVRAGRCGTTIIVKNLE
jgi:anti-sigma regulatory factor (Ser/Thr protein kinase)